MKNQNFMTTLVVEKTPREVFNAINHVRGWWSEEIEGDTHKLHDEFSYHFRDIHSCSMKLTEVIPDKRVVWLVQENHFNFIKDQSEWIGTKIIFELSEKDNKTELQFTHEGLVPAYECFDICEKAWTDYLQNSLKNLVISGKGNPNPKEATGSWNRENH